MVRRIRTSHIPRPAYLALNGHWFHAEEFGGLIDRLAGDQSFEDAALNRGQEHFSIMRYFFNVLRFTQ